MPKSSRSILLVEDEEAIARPLSKLLNLFGFEMLWAKDGIDALTQLEVEPMPSCLLIDIMMPRMNGWQLREAQLLDTRISRIPVVFFSADNQSAREAEKRGERFVAKPIDLEELRNAIQSAIDLSKKFALDEIKESVK